MPCLWIFVYCPCPCVIIPNNMRVKRKVIAKQPKDNTHCLVTKKLLIHENVGVFSPETKTEINMNNYHTEHEQLPW